MNNTYAIKDYEMEGLEINVTASDDVVCKFECEKLKVGEVNLTFEEIANIVKMIMLSSR